MRQTLALSRLVLNFGVASRSLIYINVSNRQVNSFAPGPLTETKYSAKKVAMKCFAGLLLFILLPQIPVSLDAQESMGKSRVWTATTGSTLNATLTGFAEGKILLKDQQNRTITVPSSKFIDTDLQFIKRTALNDLVTRVESRSGKITDHWPDLLLLNDDQMQLQKAAKKDRWFVWTTKNFQIHSERDLPEPIMRSLGYLFEGSLLATHLVVPGNELAEGQRLNIHLFASLENLEKESDLSSPGKDSDWNSVVCVDEMLGLKSLGNNLYTVDPMAPNRFLKMEIYELAVQQSTAAEKMPAWLYYGFRRLVSRIPQQGVALFPRAALEEMRNPRFQSETIKRAEKVPSVTYKQWRDSTEAMRGTKTEPTYRRELREASFTFCSYLRIINPKGRQLTTDMIKKAISDGGATGKTVGDFMLGGTSPADHVSKMNNAFSAYLDQQPEPLSARSIRRDRQWTNTANRSLKGELRGVQSGGRVFLKTSTGKGHFIPVDQLCDRDIAYTLANLWKSIDYERTLSDIGVPVATSKNFWPSTLSFPAASIARARFSKEESSKGKYVYKTKNFHFTLFGEYPISEDQMEEISRLFEATRELLSKSPFGIQADPVDGYFRAELFDSRKAYQLAGGPEMSGGVYLRSKRKFLVPVTRKSTKPSEGGLDAMGKYIMEIDYPKETLVHEITHMMMHDILTRLPIFMIEGSAEYIEHMPRENDAFIHTKMLQAIKNRGEVFGRIQAYYMRERKPVPTTFDFSKLLNLTRRQWFEHIGSSSARQTEMYHSSFLLVSYFMENEPDRILAMLKACRQDAPGMKIYNFEIDQYAKAVTEFKTFPGVKVNGSRYSYSSHLPHPDRPITPLTGAKSSDTAHVHLLLNRREADTVGQKVHNWLNENGIRNR